MRRFMLPIGVCETEPLARQQRWGRKASGPGQCESVQLTAGSVSRTEPGL